MEGPLGPVKVKKVVYGGLGLSHHDGSTLFLPYTAPGDEVMFEITSRKKKVLFGEPVSITESSPMRREPECPVFGKCGGCHLLHVGYEDELEIKKDSVLESLRRIGGISTEIRSMTPCPSRYGYRNSCIFEADEGGRPGFRRRESSEVVPFPGEGCLLLPEKMREAIAGIPDGALEPGAEARARLDCFDSVHFWGLADRVSPPDILMEAGGYRFPLAPDSFFQVNRLLNDTFVEKVLSLVRRTPRKLLDLYSGAGFFSFPLSKLAGEVRGIEREPGSHRSALAGKRLNKVSNVIFRKGSVEKEVFRVPEADMVVADPPRSGMPGEAMRGLLKLRPEEVILISCEPPTFARDASRLVEAGYILSEVHAMDMFPATYHVETVGLFTRS